MKAGQTRFDDTINYITNMGQAALAQHLRATIQAGGAVIGVIGGELSLDDGLHLGNDPQRHALRALLLCQRVYFSALWAPNNLLPGNWKAQSLQHWKIQTEQDIRGGIESFCITGNSLDYVANAARVQPRPLRNMLTMSRRTGDYNGVLSCYGAVMSWLYVGGLVSYRWILKHRGASDEASLRTAFGPARTIWQPAKAFTSTDRLPLVPRGHIVHLFVDNIARWNGHWLVSKGDGSACGYNNDNEGGRVNTIYDQNCSLDRQFLRGYKHDLASGQAEKGEAEVVDPLRMPNRI